MEKNKMNRLMQMSRSDR